MPTTRRASRPACQPAPPGRPSTGLPLARVTGGSCLLVPPTGESVVVARQGGPSAWPNSSSTWSSSSGLPTQAATYGRLIGYPELRPHALRHGVAVEVLEQRHDLEEVRALLGHARIDTTQIYTRIRPPQLERAVAFYEAQAQRMLTR